MVNTLPPPPRQSQSTTRRLSAVWGFAPLWGAAWVVTATLLSATATTPIWGKLADLFSKKALVQTAIVIYVAGSIVAGFSQTVGQLIAARAFQGIGVGGLQALVQVVIAAMIPPRERGRYNGYLGGVMALATVGGPLLGGLIVDTSWLGSRWCFLVGIPSAVVALILLQLTLHVQTIRRDNVKIDYLGASLIAAGVSVLRSSLDLPERQEADILE